MTATLASRARGGSWRRTAAAVRMIACLLVLLAMTGRALVAPGFMATVNAENGTFVVSMCSGGAETQTIHLDLDDPDSGEGPAEACQFAAAVNAAPPEPPFTLRLVPQLSNSGSTHGTLQHPPATNAWPRGAPPTGPPLNA